MAKGRLAFVEEIAQSAVLPDEKVFGKLPFILESQLCCIVDGIVPEEPKATRFEDLFYIVDGSRKLFGWQG